MPFDSYVDMYESASVLHHNKIIRKYNEIYLASATVNIGLDWSWFSATVAYKMMMKALLILYLGIKKIIIVRVIFFLFLSIPSLLQGWKDMST